MSKQINSDDLKKIMDTIVDNYDRIPVREEVNGQWGSYLLSELPVSLALKQMARFIKHNLDIE